MRVLLVKPCWFYPITEEESTYNRIWPPLCLANCAALLRKEGHEVRILDAHAERISLERVAVLAKNYDMVFVTSSSLDRWQCPNINLEPFVETTREISKLNKNVFVMGYHGTVDPELILKKAKAKAVIRGEPEMAVVDICRGKDFKEIKGLTYEKNGQIVSNHDRGPLNLKRLPIPAFDLLPLDKYLYEILGDKFLLFEFSRGCPFKCNFCTKGVMYSSGVRKKSLNQISKELKYAIEELGVKNAYFFDLEFSTLGARMIEKICDFLIKSKYDLKWCCQSRVDRFTPKLLRKMRRAGCELIHCGIETGSIKTLKKINKAFSLKEMAKGLKKIKRSGIKTLCFFMLGFPWETKEDIVATIRFAKRINPTYTSFHIANPYPQTGLEFFGKKTNKGLIRESCSLYFSTSELRKFVKKAFIQFYLNPKRIFKLIFDGNTKLLTWQARLIAKYILR